MKVAIKGTDNGNAGEATLPAQFSEPIRPDLIKRAVVAIQHNNRQPYGADPRAGLKHSTEVSKKRRDYRGSYGHGISRVPRKVFSRRGTRMNWEGAEMPGTRGGREAHAPKASKIWDQKINTKEKRKAIRSALHASVDLELVSARGHIAPEGFPFIIDSAFELTKKTKDLKAALLALGLEKELDRAGVKKIRAGMGKMRNRKYKTRKGPLFVVAAKCDLIKAAENIPGIDVVQVQDLNAEALAPGAVPGRLTLFTKAAVERLEAEKLFTESIVKKEATPKKEKEKKGVKKKATKKKTAKKTAKKE